MKRRLMLRNVIINIQKLEELYQSDCKIKSI
jgi:hypothetical protein